MAVESRPEVARDVDVATSLRTGRRVGGVPGLAEVTAAVEGLVKRH